MLWDEPLRAAFLSAHPHLKDFVSLTEIQNAESPRGSVLVACSFLEQQLQRIIDAFLVEGSDKSMLLEGFNAPLGTFSARIKAAHCLGLISDSERGDCDILRKIRNELAHSHTATFDDPKIASLCTSLHHSAKDYEGVELDSFAQFSTGAAGLILNLVNRAHYVSQRRLVRQTWPY